MLLAISRASVLLPVELWPLQCPGPYVSVRESLGLFATAGIRVSVAKPSRTVMRH